MPATTTMRPHVLALAAPLCMHRPAIRSAEKQGGALHETGGKQQYEQCAVSQAQGCAVKTLKKLHIAQRAPTRRVSSMQAAWGLAWPGLAWGLESTQPHTVLSNDSTVGFRQSYNTR